MVNIVMGFFWQCCILKMGLFLLNSWCDSLKSPNYFSFMIMNLLILSMESLGNGLSA